MHKTIRLREIEMSNLNITCPLCHNIEVNEISTHIRNVEDASCKMYECTSCQTHFLYPQPKSQELEDYYDGKFREEVHTSHYYEESKLMQTFLRFTPEANIRVNRIQNELAPSDDILEIGCSVGYFLKAVVDKVNIAYGTEWDTRACDYVNNYIKDDRILVRQNPEDFNIKFDKIFMFHVLEHIADPIKFLTELKKLLKPNGKIYIEVPNVDDILVKTYQSQSFKNFYYKKAHIYNFNETGLKYIFDQSDFNYNITFIQRYDISNHLYWLANQKPGGNGYYKNILSEKVNEAYIESLIDAKQTDTLFSVLTLK